MNDSEKEYRSKMHTTALQNNISVFFNRRFSITERDHLRYINEGLITNDICYILEERPIIDTVNSSINTPRANLEQRQIILHDTYLSALWCFIYSSLVLTEFNIEEGAYATKSTSARSTNDQLADQAVALFNWGYSLRDVFSFWPDTLPNPTTQDNRWSEITNEVFLYSVCYILFHEYAHLVNKHINHYCISPVNEKERSLNTQLEAEADQFAYDAMLNYGSEEIDHFRVGMGMLHAHLFSVFLLTNISLVRQRHHPDLDHRFLNLIEQLNLTNDRRERFFFVSLFALVKTFNKLAPFISQYVVGDNAEEGVNYYIRHVELFKSGELKMLSKGETFSTTYFFGGFRQANDPRKGENAFNSFLRNQVKDTRKESNINLYTEWENTLSNRWSVATRWLMRERKPDNVYIFAYSMGCHLALRFAKEIYEKWPIRKVILLAPDPKYRETKEDLEGTSAYQEAKMLWLPCITSEKAEATLNPGTFFCETIEYLIAHDIDIELIINKGDLIAEWDGNVSFLHKRLGDKFCTFTDTHFNHERMFYEYGF